MHFRAKSSIELVSVKADLRRTMAERCLAGEFGGSSWVASQEPECVTLGIAYQTIQYHMDRIDPIQASTRAASRARVEIEALAAETSNGVKATFIFVERGGSASAAAAVSGIMSKLESELGARVGEVAHLARCEASAAHQAELEVAGLETAGIEKKLSELKARQLDHEAEARRFAKEAAREIAHLQGLLAGEQKRADAADASKSVMSEAKAEALHKAKMFQKSLIRLQEKFAEIEAKPSSSGIGMTWDEEDVLEMEGVIAELTTELRELRGAAKAKEREFERNRGAVANMGSKYVELAELRDTVKVLTTKITSLEAELAVARSNPLPGFEVPLYDIRRDASKRGAPYPRYFEDVIVPAMLSTGATPDQINEIISKLT